jgi:hypothetical protein
MDALYIYLKHGITDTHVVYTAWNLWKKRCRRVLLDNKATDVQHLLESIQDDIQSLHMPRDKPE